MKSYGHIKSRGSTKINPQQVAFEQKRKMVLALNKLADRDTYQIAVDELEKTAECLTPDGVAPFLSCILDTDSEQKSAVRKECIRLIGTLVRFHEDLAGPHIGKMMTSVVKRLKDPDSVVRDACVETVGVLASKLSNSGSESDGVFVLLVKPLFEALGEQNKQVQSGSALCLARVIDNTNDPPVSVLHRMLTKTTKLLKNPHFVAKPAIVELNRSIIQAGGALTHDALSAAMVSIQETLKNSDWTTRKAASVALAEIASGGGAWLGSFKASCIRSLESCRFDKVKPVRDTVMQALHNWRVTPGSDTPDASEVGSFIKENFCGGDYNDHTSTNESGRRERDVVHKVAGPDTKKKRVPLSVMKTCQDYTGNKQHSRADDWHIVIADTKAHNVSLANLHNDESVCSSVTKTSERMSRDVTFTQDVGYEYVPMDDKQECSSVSDDFENKFVSVSQVSLGEGDLLNSTGRDHRFATEEVSGEEQMYLAKMRDRRSLDSTVTESSPRTASGCCLRMENEMHCIRKQLLEIETKQSALMDLMQMFTSSTMDSLSMIQAKVSGLEQVVDKIADGLIHSDRYSSDSAISKLMKHGYSIASPRISTSTPRSSVDVCSRPPSMLSAKKSENREQKTYGRSKSDNSAKEGMDMWTNSTVKTTVKDIQKNTTQRRQNTGSGQLRKPDSMPYSKYTVNGRQSGSESRNSLWECVKGFLRDGDFDSAYMEALCSGDELILVELLATTGPVLESLSPKTVSDVLCTLVSLFQEQRCVNSIIPWIQQVVDLSSIHGPNYLALSAKARREIVFVIHEALNMEFSISSERRTVSELSTRLRQMWGSGPKDQHMRRVGDNEQVYAGSK